MNIIVMTILGTIGATLLSMPVLKWLKGAFNVDDIHMQLKQNIIWFTIGSGFLTYFIVFEIFGGIA